VDLTAVVGGKTSEATMTDCLNSYFRLPSDWHSCIVSDASQSDSGFFNFGSDLVCYGRCQTGYVAKTPTETLYDAWHDVHLSQRTVHLPIDPEEIIQNFYRERYEPNLRPRWEKILGHTLIRKSYYLVRELLPVALRRRLQRAYFSGWKKLPFPQWPLDSTVDVFHKKVLALTMEALDRERVPFIWFWPDGAPSCFIMTHDIEDRAGRDFTRPLMDLDESYGLRSSFQVIPEERYEISEAYVCEIRNRGFEFNIHDLNHDGGLYHDKPEFLRRAAKINSYARRYGSRGFRAGSMHRNADWYDAFEFSYDMSIPNVAHLEPRRGGCCTVMPFFVGDIVELPLTTTQDFSLFHILNDYSLDLWKTQIDLIRQHNGLVSFITHADYLTTEPERKVYKALLRYLRETIDRDKVWAPLPGEVNRWWRARNQMTLEPDGKRWKITGPENERARVAFAVLRHGQLTYEWQ
jgi:hypothetical protein